MQIQIEMKSKELYKMGYSKRTESEKLFASITVKELKSNLYTLTFVDLIYHSLILIFEDSLRNPAKANEELVKAHLIVEESSFTAEIKRNKLFNSTL